MPDTTKILKDINGNEIKVSPSNLSEVDISDLKNEGSDAFVKETELESGLDAVREYADENDQMLYENDEILANNICLPYDSTATYEVDDIAIYKNQLVRCTVAITEPEDFNVEHWTPSTVKFNFVTKNGGQRITGEKVFDGSVTFNGNLSYTGTGSLIINPSYLGINNSEVQTNNTSVEIGAGSNKTYKNRLPSTFYSTVTFNDSPNVKSDLNFLGTDNKAKMTFNRDGNLYFKDGTAWSVNIDDTHKLRYTKSDGQLELRNGDLKLSDGFKIKWGGGSAYIQGNSANQCISFGINNFDKLIFYGGYSQFNSDLRLNSMGTNSKSVTTKEYVDNIFTRISGYDATKTQVLKNINGTLTWVDE